jgi:hypothetical protein
MWIGSLGFAVAALYHAMYAVRVSLAQEVAGFGCPHPGGRRPVRRRRTRKECFTGAGDLPEGRRTGVCARRHRGEPQLDSRRGSGA